MAQKIIGDDDDIVGRSYANLRESNGDAAAGAGTRYRIGLGDTFQGSLSPSGDSDWIAIDLRAGQGVQVRLAGVGLNSLDDPVFQIYDSAGNVVGFADDNGDSYNPVLGLYSQSGGRYYIAVNGFDAYGYSGGTGNYRLSIGNGMYSHDQIARQLTNGYWESNGQERRAFDVRPGQTLNVDLSGLDATGRALALAALETWTQMSGIRFSTRGTGPADITFDDAGSMSAYSTSDVSSSGDILSSHVNVSRDWLTSSGTTINSYSFQTYIHEIGHALGLGHAGNYNGSADWGEDNFYVNDSWQSSIMSYFSQTDNPSVPGPDAYTVTGMIADIIAIRNLYGAASLRRGDTVYGEETNAGGIYARIARMLNDPAKRDDFIFTVLDDGGHDKLVLDGDRHNQNINLNAGTMSSAYGLHNNISIARGTIIEDFVAGSGSDRITGNAANNKIWGGAGNDTINGGAGNDTLYGGAGRDQLIGGNGNDTFGLNSAQDIVVERAGGGIDTVIANGFSYRLGANLERLMLTGGGSLNGTGNDASNRITGSDGNNKLMGMGGNDILIGGAGNDRLDGGRGYDTLRGGAGADIFVFNAGHDRIVDFQDNHDTLVLSRSLWGGAALTVQQVLRMASVVAGDVVFDFGNGHRLQVEGINRVGALADDLVFA